MGRKRKRNRRNKLENSDIGFSTTNNNLTNKEKEEKIKKQMCQDKPLVLRFSPTAWAKLLYMRDAGNTEVGGFGVTKENDLLYIEKFCTVKQECSSVTVEFDDESVADFAMDQVEEGRNPRQFMRVWIHTHPGMSPTPSMKDEETFARVFGKCDWAVMVILASDGKTYCRLQMNKPFKGYSDIPIKIDFSSHDFEATDKKAWKKEYDENISEELKWQFSSGYHGYYGSYNHEREFCNKTFPDHHSLAKLNNYSNKINDINIVNNNNRFVAAKSNLKEDQEIVFDELSIPSDVIEYIDPNTMSLLEFIDEQDRKYVYDEIRKKNKIGD